MFVLGHNNCEHNHPYLKPRVNIQLENSALFTKMTDFVQWLGSPEAQKVSEPAKSKAWKNFLARFLNADKSKFEAQVYYENAKDHQGKAKIYFKKGRGFLSSFFGSDSNIRKMKAALGKPNRFPQKLLPIGGSSLPIPAVSFHSAAPSLKKIFNNSIDIYASLDQYFTTKFREIFLGVRQLAAEFPFNF